MVSYKYKDTKTSDSMESRDFIGLRGLILKLFENKGIGTPIYKTAIHKILYKLYTVLPDDNKIRDQLPFYWYNYGPFSEVVAGELSALAESGILVEVTADSGNTMLQLSGPGEYPDTSDFEEASYHLENITKNVDLYNIKPFISEMYNNSAPVKLYPLFKLGFLDPLTKLADKPIVTRREISSLERTLYKCEAFLPSDNIFDDFNESFSSFVTSTARIFDEIDDGEDTGYLTDMCSARTEQTWMAFTKGVRILHHHDYYNQKVPHWNILYERSLKTYIRDIEIYYEDVLADLKRERLKVVFVLKGVKELLIA